METRARLIISAAFASLLLIADSSAAAQTAPGLEASEPHWGSSPTVNVTPHSFPVDRGQAANYPRADEVSALFRNTGPKAVKSVTWKYVFYKDERRTEPLATYTFSSGKTILPGASARLKESVSALSGPRQWTNYHAVLVTRIRYADGTVWQAAGSKK